MKEQKDIFKTSNLFKLLSPFNFLDKNEALESSYNMIRKDPEKMLRIQRQIFSANIKIQQKIIDLQKGGYRYKSNDKRFKSQLWQSSSFHNALLISYVVNVAAIEQAIDGLDKENPRLRRKLKFILTRFFESLSPSNFFWGNPEVLKKTIETGGTNLQNGLANFLNDYDHETDELKIKMVRPDAFVLGRDLAASKGKVIFRNKLLELIQYSPSTQKVRSVPLLIVPPWINKFYILDLKKENSFVKYAVESGLTVFMISWLNPKEEAREIVFDDYAKGLLECISLVKTQTRSAQVNCAGYCIGGTLLAIALAILEKRNDLSVKSATFLTSLLDFDAAGDLDLFVDEESIDEIESLMETNGYLDAEVMSSVFSLLRAKDLIWFFYINNYLFGEKPPDFDILFWNADSTRLPASAHSWYLRNMYIENKLSRPNSLEVCAEKINLKALRIPTCFVSAKEDHIAPWPATYKGTKLLNGKKLFILTDGGHVAGIVNAPDSKAYGHYSRIAYDEGDSEWLNRSKRHDYSWWITWRRWIISHSGIQKPSSCGETASLGDAPGQYVLRK